MDGYLLGIDLGNTKTEYLLCSAEGEFKDIYNVRSPGRDSFETAIKGIKKQLAVLLDRNNIGLNGISAVGIGLSIPHSQEERVEIKDIVKRILGVEHIDISTDTGHGTYAYRLGKGVGIYSFASTGDITMGLTFDSKWVIVGGLRLFAGDEASGSFLYRKSLSLLYDYHYRCGEFSTAFPELTSLVGIDESDVHRSLKNIPGNTLKAKSAEIIKVMDWAALAGDDVAMRLFDDAGESAAKAAAGCIVKMGFPQADASSKPLPIVLIGSIWNKIIYDGMRDNFLRKTETLSGRGCSLVLPEAPPVTGGVMKAKEALDGKRVTEDFRTRVLDSAALRSTEMEIAALHDSGCQSCDVLRHYITIRKNRPLVAAKLEIDRRVSDMLSGYSLLKGIDVGLIAILLPAACSIMMEEDTKALALLASASKYITKEKGHVEAYNDLVNACLAAAGN